MTKLQIFQQVDIEGNNEETNVNFGVNVINKKGRKQKIYVHGYLLGLMIGAKEKANHKFAFNAIIIGNLGSGKSTLAQQLAGIRNTLNGKKLTWEHITWDAEDFAIKYHEEEGTPLIFDEAISGRKLNTSSEGEQVKKSIITGRFRLRSAFYLSMDLQDFHPQLIRMTDCLIRVRNFGFKRGYWDCYTNKWKIDFIYKGMKYYNKTWNSKEIKNLSPDSKGKFYDTTNVFYDDDEYNKMKLEAIKVKNESDRISWSEQKLQAYLLYSQGLRSIDVVRQLNINESTMGNWVRDFKNYLPPKNMKSSE